MKVNEQLLFASHVGRIKRPNRWENPPKIEIAIHIPITFNEESWASSDKNDSAYDQRRIRMKYSMAKFGCLSSEKLLSTKLRALDVNVCANISFVTALLRYLP